MIENEQVREKLQKVLRQTMADSAFIFTDPLEEELEEDAEVVEAVLSFEGIRAGRLRLSVPYLLSIELAANLLGLEPDDPDVFEMAENSVGEFLNIFAGSLIESLFGVEETYYIDSPEVKRISRARAQERRQDSVCSICQMAEEEFRIDVSLHLEKVVDETSPIAS